MQQQLEVCDLNRCDFLECKIVEYSWNEFVEDNFNGNFTKLTTLKTAKLKGKWELIRKEDNPKGIFWLELEKFNTKWLITKDSTLSFE